jgi:1,2-dihydroxy-3-keto-5-methylthiopentene dioxygenase
MALLKVPDEDRTVTDAAAVRDFLSEYGIEYERTGAAPGLSAESTSDEILAAWTPKIDELKARGGYVVADVIDVKPETPNLDAMLKRFSSEHWHDEDEVRLIVDGRGLFHIHPPGRPVFALEVEPGDLIRVPRGTHHWFDLCGDRRIRAIRLFQDPSGWTPHYTESGEDSKYQPLCFGPTYIPVERVAPNLSV